MKRTIITVAALVAVLIPAAAGLWGNASFSQAVPVRVPASAEVVTPTLPTPTVTGTSEVGDDHGGETPRDQRTEPGDDRDGATSTPTVSRSTDDGDDHGGETPRDQRTEPGDDRDGESGNSGPGSDDSGHGSDDSGHGSDDSGSGHSGDDDRGHGSDD
jgi:hypothetical protein